MTSLTLDSGREQRLFYYRAGSSDELVLRQVFQERHHAFEHWQRAPELLALIARRSEAGQRPLVIDGGANLGASTVFFASKIPEARIVAVEPAPQNFELLQKNTAGLNVDLRQAALGATPGRAEIVDPGQGHWSYRVAEAVGDSGSVPVVTLDDIYRAYRTGHFPFLVKLDIEGGEKELFSANTEWMRSTPVIIIEPHDWMLPKTETVRPFLERILLDRRDILVQGENIVAIAHDLD